MVPNKKDFSNNNNMSKPRNTIQKQKILEYLKSVKTHPTAEIVHKEVQIYLPSISLGTVYRNLNDMADKGEIFRFEVNKEYHYDSDISKHHHCVCGKCGQISDCFNKEITNIALKKFSNTKFIPENVFIIYKGKCVNC